MAANAESEAHLNALSNRFRMYVGGETLSENVIALRRNPTATSVFEEIIHTAQLRRGMSPKTDLIRMEIEAAEKLIRYRRAYGIPNTQTRQTIERLLRLAEGK